MLWGKRETFMSIGGDQQDDMPLQCYELGWKKWTPSDRGKIVGTEV
jgi:hypothetical protein